MRRDSPDRLRTIPKIHTWVSVVTVLLAGCSARPDWPMFGRDASRNAVIEGADPPAEWRYDRKAPERNRNVLWTAQTGYMLRAAPVAADGLVWAGGNNARGGDIRAGEDGGVLMCFRAEDGAPLWERLSPRRRPPPEEADWPYNPLRGSPLVEGDRLWYLDNRWEVVCLDIGPLKRGTGKPVELWKTDLISRLGVHPIACMMATGSACSIGASHGGNLYVSTGNGVGFRTDRVQAPDAPALVCLDRETGEITGREASGISARTLHANWSSPALGEAGGRAVLVYGGGDGFLYGFDPVPVAGDEGLPVLRELWRVDVNPADPKRRKRFGILGTPVVHGGRVYACLGDDPTRGDNHGNLICVDLETGRSLWEVPDFGVSLETPVVRGGRVYAVEMGGYVRCLDAETGTLLWRYDFFANAGGSPIIVGGRLLVATDEGEMFAFDLDGMNGLAERIGPPVEFERNLRGKAQGRIHAFAPDNPENPLRIGGELNGCAGMAYAGGVLFISGRLELVAIRGSAATGLTDSPRPKRGSGPDAVWVPTPKDVVRPMLALAGVTKDDVVFDLGSGDGPILLAAAGNPGCRVVGYELNGHLVEAVRKAAKAEPLRSRVTVVQRDLLEADLSEATVITLYVGERLNHELLPKLRALRPGVRIVTHEFPLPGMVPDRVQTLRSRETGRDHVIHLWTTPLREEPK